MARALGTGVLSVILCIALHAQPNPASRWARSLGGTSSDIAYDVLPMEDGGCLVAGATVSYGAGGWDIYLIRLDSSGSTNWTRTYGTARNEKAIALRFLPDGDILLAGTAQTYAGGPDNIYMAKLRPSGILYWDRTYGYAYAETPADLLIARNGDFVIAGTSRAGGDPDILLRRFDPLGNVRWTRLVNRSALDQGLCVRETGDDGFIVAGRTVQQATDGCLVKTTSNGTVSWTRTYGGADEDVFQCVEQLPDGGFIASGFTTSYGVQPELFFVRTNASGQQRWARHYRTESRRREARAMLVSANTDLIVAGARERRGLLARFDSAAAVLWELDFGGSDSVEFNACRRSADGGYFLAGRIRSAQTGDENFYVVRTGPDPQEAAIEPAAITVPFSFALSVFPNPFNPRTTLALALPRHAHVRLELFDLCGRLVRTLYNGTLAAGEHRVEVDASDLAAGVYLAHAKAGPASRTVKLLLVK